MARIRTIKPEAFRSETLSQLSVNAERSFYGLLTEVDDKGRGKYQPAVLNGGLWPLRPEHTAADMVEDMEAMAEAGLLCFYTVDGVAYFHLTSFLTHQVISRPSKTKIPGCVDCPVEKGGVAVTEPVQPVEHDLFTNQTEKQTQP